MCSDAPFPHFGVAVVAKVPLARTPVADENSDPARRCVVVELSAPGIDLRAVYMPYAGLEVGKFQAAALERPAQAGERDAHVVGDFNAGIPESDVPDSARPAGNGFVRKLRRRLARAAQIVRR